MKPRKVVVECLCRLRRLCAKRDAKALCLVAHLRQPFATAIQERYKLSAGAAKYIYRNGGLAGAVLHARKLLGKVAQHLIASTQLSIRPNIAYAKRLERGFGLASALRRVTHALRQTRQGRA